MFKNKKAKIIILSIALGILIPTIFVFASKEAGQPTGLTGAVINTIGGTVFIIAGYLCQIAAIVIGLFLWLIGTIFDWIIGGTTINSGEMNEIVTAGWVIVRDILNIVFVLALLGIAFATILRIESYHFKALLPKLLVAALLVNFSKTICLTLIDFANAIMNGIMGTQGGHVSSAAIAALFNLSDFWSIDDAIKLNLPDLQVLITNIAIVVFLGMLCMALAGLAVLLIIRTVVLMILTVFSPIAFVLNVLPITQKYASKWWEEFTKYLFVGPVVCICYLLALLFAVRFSQGGAADTLSSSASQAMHNVGVSQTTIGQFFGFAIACGIMFVGFTFTKEVAQGMAGAVMGLVKKGLTGAAGLAGGFIWRKANESLASGHRGLIGRGISKGLRLARVNPETADKWGNITRFASPQVLANMWKQRQAIRSERAMTGAAGFVHNWVNKATNHLPGMGHDETDYEERENLEEVDKYLSEAKKYGRGSHAYLRKELRSAQENHEWNKAMAYEIALAQDGNTNEAHRENLLGGKGKVRNVEYDENGDVKIDPTTGKEVKVPDKIDYETDADGNLKLDAAGLPIPKRDASGKIVMRGGNEQDFGRKAYIDRLITTYGKKRAFQIMAASNEAHRKNGNWNLAELLNIDENGEYKLNLNQPQDAAGEWTKKSGREGLGGQRFQLFEEDMAANGAVVDVRITDVFKEKIRKSGIGKNWIDNIGFMMDTNKFMVNQFRGRLYRFIEDEFRAGRLSRANRDNTIKMIQEAVKASGGPGAKHYKTVRETTRDTADNAAFDRLPRIE